jgi:hypothetical protein
MGMLYEDGQEFEKAIEAYEKAMAISQAFINEYPDSELSQSDMAYNHYQLANAYRAIRNKDHWMKLEIYLRSNMILIQPLTVIRKAWRTA